jgi:hypothetical protein
MVHTWEIRRYKFSPSPQYCPRPQLSKDIALPNTSDAGR